MEGDSSSRSPAARRISFGLQALGAKLSRTLSRDDKDADSRSISTVGSNERSLSRGRDVYQSSGRGGAGNIRRASISRDARPSDGPDDFSITRGREPVPASRTTFSTGRGGAGNIRSPSRDPAADSLDGDTGLSDAEVIRAHVAAIADVPYSSGRGGAGNIFPSSRSRSRSRGPATVLASPNPGTGTPPRPAGRASIGNINNIADGSGVPEEILEHEEDEEENKTDVKTSNNSKGGIHKQTATNPTAPASSSQRTAFISTGRGGAGNRVNK